jgi:Na+/proline symporter
LIAGIGVLGIVFYRENLNSMGQQVDFEQIMPYVLNNFIPAGLLGLMLAGLLAAFMSTFDCTVNAGASYLVKDIYQRYIRPDASDRRLVAYSYMSSILIVIVGIGFGFTTKSINQVLQWIVAGLYGGYIAPNVLKWYWWRFNGHGYFAGMISGIAAAMILPKLLPNMSPLNSFPILLLLSGSASIIVCLLTKPEPMRILKQFYMQTRPWGFWKPVTASLQAEGQPFEVNRMFKRDAVNVLAGIVWQLSLCVLPIYLVIRHWRGFGWSAAVLIATSVFLKINWYDKLQDEIVTPTDSGILKASDKTRL